MKVTFLYGRSGSGKTYEVTQQLRRSAEQEKRSFLLVPEQQSHAAERKMLSILPPKAQLTVETLSFSRLANRVFRQYGGLSSVFVMLKCSVISRSAASHHENVGLYNIGFFAVYYDFVH